METAKAFWKLDDLINDIVRQVVETGKLPHEVIDALMPVRLRPEDQAAVVREGLIFLVNGRRGMRGFRSGRVQTVRSGPKALPEESDGVLEFGMRILERLVYVTADGVTERSVLDFTHEDAAAAFDRRVRAVREQADREEAFWSALMRATSHGRPVRAQPVSQRTSLAKLAIAAKLASRE